jgi:hypothetical protein
MGTHFVRVAEHRRRSGGSLNQVKDRSAGDFHNRAIVANTIAQRKQ